MNTKLLITLFSIFAFVSCDLWDADPSKSINEKTKQKALKDIVGSGTLNEAYLGTYEVNVKDVEGFSKTVFSKKVCTDYKIMIAKDKEVSKPAETKSNTNTGTSSNTTNKDNTSKESTDSSSNVAAANTYTFTVACLSSPSDTFQLTYTHKNIIVKANTDDLENVEWVDVDSGSIIITNYTNNKATSVETTVKTTVRFDASAVTVIMYMLNGKAEERKDVGVGSKKSTDTSTNSTSK